MIYTTLVASEHLRYSDSIERLCQTRNLEALQDHLGHASPLMTLRYLSTLQEEGSRLLPAALASLSIGAEKIP